MNNISVVYTPWANLKKTGDMDVGQIGFHRQKDVSGRFHHLDSVVMRLSVVDLHYSCLLHRLRPWL